jgi:hypothetical protein
VAVSAAPAEIGAAPDAKRRPPEAVLEHVESGADLIVGLANGEPATIVDALEAGASELEDVRIHQMFPLRERSYMHSELEDLRHVSWFLSPGASFIVLHSTTSDESTPRIVARLHPGAAVTSHPEFREGLEREGRELGFI